MPEILFDQENANQLQQQLIKTLKGKIFSIQTDREFFPRLQLHVDDHNLEVINTRTEDSNGISLNFHMVAPERVNSSIKEGRLIRPVISYPDHPATLTIEEDSLSFKHYALIGNEMVVKSTIFQIVDNL